MKMLPTNCLRHMLACLVTFSLATSVFATPPSVVVPPAAESPESDQTRTNEATAPTGFLEGIKRSSYLLGDVWGLRTLLSKYGMSLAVSETSEVLGNVSGGVKQGA